MKIERQRSFFNASNKRLRRARRLYVALCLKSIEKFGNPIIDLMAKRAQEHGLYSDKTNIMGIRHSINGHHFQLTKDRTPPSFMRWHNWCRLMDIDPYNGHFNHKKRIKL